MIARSDFFPALQTREPVLHTNSADRVLAWLSALFFCLTLLAMALCLIWVAGITVRSPTLTRSIEILPWPDVLPGGEPAIHTALVVDSPVDMDDPAVVPDPGEAAALAALIAQASNVPSDSVADPGTIGPGEGPGPGVIIITEPPPHEPQRWVFVIEGIGGVEDYALMLDQLGIEIGAFDQDNRFAYVVRASEAAPSLRRPTEARDERFYTVWRSGALAELDRELFVRSGMRPRGDAILHFFSAQLETRLAELERVAAHGAGKKVRDVRRTWFTLVAENGTFDFRVTRQQFRDYGL